MKFITLDNFPLQDILDAHNKAFSDYEVPMQIPLEHFHYLNERRGVRYDLSMGAVDDGSLVGFVLNGVDQWRGKLTAYDCGTGVVPDYRKQGIGAETFSRLIPILHQAGIHFYLLEVLQENAPAISLYQKKNFKTTREFLCLGVKKDDLIEKLRESGRKCLAGNISIKSVDSLDWEKAQQYEDFSPSWQNSTESINRVPESFHLLAAFHEKTLVGHAVFRVSGELTQIGIHPKYRRHGVATAFLEEMVITCPKAPQFHILNIDTRDEALTAFLQHYGFNVFTKQYEMEMEF